MKENFRIRYIFFILLGVLVLLLKQFYTGPWMEWVYRYASNVSVSFATYFIARLGSSDLTRLTYPRFFSAAGSFLAVETFELTNGFGVMSNFYDPWDYLANAVGIMLALGLDTILKDPEKQAPISQEPP
jgi:drug/metabolite transporter (DMT)-like permease